MIENGVVERFDDEVAGIQCFDEAIAVVHHIGVGATGRDGEGSIEANKLKATSGDGRTGETHTFLCTPADGHHRALGRGHQVVAVSVVDIAIVLDHIADGIAAGLAIQCSTCLHGHAGVIGCDRCIIGPVNPDRQACDVGEATAVTHRVVELVAEALAWAESINGSIAVVDHIGVAAVGTDGEDSIAACQHEATASIGSPCRAGTLRRTDADRRNRSVERRSVVPIDIGVVAEHVAGGIAAGDAIGHAARFQGSTAVVAGDRGIIDTVDADVQNSGVSQAAWVIENRVVERFDNEVAGIQFIDDAVAVVHHIGVAAIGRDGEGAVEADKLEASSWDRRTGETRAFLGSTADGRDRRQRWCHAVGTVVSVNIAIVADHIAGGIAAGRAVQRATGFNGCAAVVGGNRSVVAALNVDCEHSGARAIAVADVVIKKLAQRVSSIKCINHRIAVVYLVDRVAIGLDGQRAVEAREHQVSSCIDTSCRA